MFTMQDLQKDINLCISPSNFFPEKKMAASAPRRSHFFGFNSN
tara:strand:+ start:1286 stop:1414 length:129 start_codon:yes stop_codon:yes gene_type:complete